MSKRKERREKAELFIRVREATEPRASGEIIGHDAAFVTDEMVAASPILASLVPPLRRELPRMKKFRFQLLHAWIKGRLEVGRMADVGGGKGLLAYLLQEDGWQVTVIDPVSQALPEKYKSIATDRQTRIPPEARVPRRDQPFAPEMVQDFDVLVAMHAHGCNLQLIDAAAEFGRTAVLLPCCLIQEPLIPLPGVSWIQALADYAIQKGFVVEPFRLNFKGQNIGLYLHH